ncbi:hypothetical protein ACFVXA_07615 [Streptomyces sp. NPDC058246]|uniref:hypothetical protein n=1 Tax=Streptomyces sp. NPDC058246 TaxID=3346400 RepID=UPI0036E9209F
MLSSPEPGRQSVTRTTAVAPARTVGGRRLPDDLETAGTTGTTPPGSRRQHDLEEEPEMTVLLTDQRAALEELRPDGGLLL